MEAHKEKTVILPLGNSNYHLVIIMSKQIITLFFSFKVSAASSVFGWERDIPFANNFTSFCKQLEHLHKTHQDKIR